ncbi:DUF5818 domain-containing protein [Sphingomonas panacis]|uniref:DUF5818 domain-containing protein n=1 Tax=Sphingomonas panacis TaxID=1560345 RepID=UPI001F0ABEB7|nr:DUF5818 domain-containing protein [Sphingomonas panacis]
MPHGSRHRETGLLLRSSHGLALRRDDGGVWQLDAPHRAYHLIGQRVRLEGIRDGFDLLGVTQIEPLSGRWPTDEARPNLFRRAVDWLLG